MLTGPPYSNKYSAVQISMLFLLQPITSRSLRSYTTHSLSQHRTTYRWPHKTHFATSSNTNCI